MESEVWPLIANFFHIHFHFKQKIKNNFVEMKDIWLTSPVELQNYKTISYLKGNKSLKIEIKKSWRQ